MIQIGVIAINSWFLKSVWVHDCVSTHACMDMHACVYIYIYAYISCFCLLKGFNSSHIFPPVAVDKNTLVAVRPPSTQILIFNNICTKRNQGSSEKWLISELHSSWKISLQHLIMIESKKALKNCGGMSQGQDSSLKGLPLAKSWMFEHQNN